jgi:hypothetical protein
MKKIKRLFSIIGIFLLIVAIVYIVGLKLADNKQEPEITTIDIQGTINDIGELATAEYGYTIAQTAEKPSKTMVGFEVPFTKSKVMYSYEGFIKAGINFKEIEVTVNEVKKTVFVELPDAVILSSEVDFDSLIVYDGKYSPFNAFTFSDMNLSLSDLKNTAEESALSNGLLDRANENAQTIIWTTIGSLYNQEEYDVKFY